MKDFDDIYDELDDLNQEAQESAAASVAPSGASAAAPQGIDARAYKAELLSRLNPDQARAVGMGHQSCLVLAGAGSGKTSLLTARIAYLRADGLDATQIMAVTFTNKAAQEMRNRLSKILPRRDVEDLWVGTFHSLCNRILRECHKEAGLQKNFGILDTDGQEALVRSIMRDSGLLPTKAEREGKLKKASKAGEGDAAQQTLSMHDPLSAAGAQAAESSPAPSSGPAEDDEEAEEEKRLKPSEVVSWINKRKEFGVKPDEVRVETVDDETKLSVYREYQAQCEQQGLLDFSDLLYRCVELLERDSFTRGRYRGILRAILIDEFQDTNDIQYRWVQLLKSERAFVMAVGDDDQSIYAFRGANPENMQRFANEMTVTPENPQGVIIKLEQNYRSLPYILDAANGVIGHNTNRIGKELWSPKADGGETIEVVEYENAFLEAKDLGAQIHDLVRNKGVQPSEIAILYRMNTQSRLLEQELNKLSIPVTVYGGFRFFERQEVKHVLAYMELACSFERDVSFARVVNFPPRGIGERTVEDLRQEAKENGISMMTMIGQREELAPTMTAGAAKKHAQLVEFATMMVKFAERAQTITLSELVHEIVVDSGIQAFYEAEVAGSGKKKGDAAKSEAQERLDNINELISAARQFELDNPEITNAAELLPEYLSFVQLMTSTSEADMDKKNTVSLMTVHASKGLEFDHVFVAGVEEGIFPHARAVKEDEAAGYGSPAPDGDAWLRAIDGTEEEEGAELEPGSDLQEEAPVIDGPGVQEERRLMYVAMTRARKHLKMSHAVTRINASEEVACSRSRFVLEIPKSRMTEVNASEREALDHTTAGPRQGATGSSFALGGARKPGFSGGRPGGALFGGGREYGGDGHDGTRAPYQPGSRNGAPFQMAHKRQVPQAGSQAAPMSKPVAPVAQPGLKPPAVVQRTAAPETSDQAAPASSGFRMRRMTAK